MAPISSAYLAALASQLGSLSAFLGGFAATVLVTLITIERRTRAHTVAVVLSAVGALSFIVSVVASSKVLAAFGMGTPRPVAQASSLFARALMTLSFGVGIFSLLGAIGAGGWLYSRRVGLITSVGSAIAAVLVIMLTVEIG